MTTDAPIIAPGEDCWKKKGVFSTGKPTCDTLNQVIHCRNCDVYTRAGRRLLDRELPDAYQEIWTTLLAEDKSEESPDTLSTIVFRVGREWLAIRTAVLGEILKSEPIHCLPHNKNSALAGIVNVHGEIRLCISLKALLGIRDADAETEDKQDKQLRRRRMMVVRDSSEEWVFPVDEIQGIHQVHPDMFQNVPATVAQAKPGATFTEAIFAWDDHQIALLDHSRLLLSLSRTIQ